MKSISYKKIFSAVLAYALCLAMVFTVQPLGAFASEYTADETTTYLQDSEITSTASEAAEPYIIKEIESKRDAFTKHFLLSDGSYLATTYDIPVHYKDETGAWQQYDNSLEEDSSNSESLINKKSDTAVLLSKKAKRNKMIQVKYDGHLIYWGYSGINNSPAELITDDTTLTGNDKHTKLKNISVSSVYRDAFPNVDLYILIKSGSVKENLVINEPGSVSSFVVNYDIGDLTAIQQDSKTILLKNDLGETIYTISAPLMYDSNMHYSESVTLKMTANGKKVTVELSADEEWLNAPERAYPVTVDPSLQTSQTPNAIESASLLSRTLSYDNYPHNYLYVGGEAQVYGYSVSLVKTSLPELNPGDMVVGGQIAMFQCAYGGTGEVQVNVSRITSSWNESDYITSGTINASYRNPPSYDTKIEDFNFANLETLAKAEEGELTYWDISSIVKGWYNGEANNGVIFRANTSNLNNMVWYSRDIEQSEYGSLSFPVILISYVNNNGLESHWSYHDIGVTSRGTAYVNDYTGNLVATENIFNTTGNRMPMSISLFYNLSNYNKNFKYGASAGYGFMFNFQQRIDAVTDTKLIEKGYKYIYTDADGTEHYFRLKEGSTAEWIDEEGLGLTLKNTGESGSGMYLYYKDGTVSHFYLPNYSGVLYYTKDTYGNRIRYYSTTPFGTEYGRLITSIADGAGRTVAITYELYNNIPRVKTISDNESRVYSFAYNTSDPTLLESITYPDGTVTTYSYNSKRLSSVSDSLGYKTDFAFMGSGSITKTQIKTVTSYSVENNTNYLIGRLTFAYNKDNTTTVTDYDGQSQLYQFDNYGRTTSIRYPDGTITNGTYYATTGIDDSESSAPATVVNNNKLISQSTSEKYVNNYVVNPSAERTAAFYSTHWAGVAGDAHSYDSTVAYFGTRSLKICNDGEDEYYNLYAQQLFTTDFSDKDYTFSAYVKTENVIPQTTNGAGLLLQFYNSDGTSLGIHTSEYYLTGTNDWTRISVSGHAPLGTAEVRVYCGLRYATGTAWFDCLQLETNAVMNDFNLVENSDFSNTTVWTTASFGTDDSFSGNGKVTIVGGATANKFIYQLHNVNKADVCFNAFGTLNGTLTAARDGRLTGIEIYIKYSDGVKEYHNKNFNYATTAEQSISFIAKPKRAGIVIETVGVYFIYRKTANTINLENMMVTFDEQGTSYAYDSNGNLISSGDNAERNQAYQYNSAKELTKYTNDKNESYSYIYDTANAHKLIAARSNQLGNGYHYSYDSYGNIIGTAMGEIDSDGVLNTALEFITALQAYNSTGNYVISETDSRNNTTYYSINDANGLLNSVTTTLTVNGIDQSVTTYYTYYPDTRLLQSVTTGNSSVTYTYDAKRRLKTITANGNVYTFNYDAYGNRISVLVGNTALITYTYAVPRKGLVTTVTYANGDVIGYQYDEYDRLILKDIDEYTQYRVYYNSKGQVAKTEDTYIAETAEYIYDLSGRLVQKIVDENGLSVYKYKYDNLSRVTDYTETVNGVSVAQNYTYGADSLLNEMEQGNFEYSYSYDHLNRLTSKTATLSEGKTARIEHTYIYGTALVGTKKFYLNNVLSETLSYTYDKSGNIATVTKDGVLLESYQYDELGQLVKTTKGSDIYEYTYDTRGNILTAKLNGVVTDTYAYGDANWKDKLTAFNGEQITYDNVGNPLQYRDGMYFYWEKGRTLSGVEMNGGEGYTAYITNSDGIRINKNVMWFAGNNPNAIYAYEYNGTQLISQKWGSNTVRFLYDESGCPTGFILNGAYYYYITNVQGDITGITDANGNIVAKYTYDEWGKPLSITDGNGNDVSANENHIANINPLRYRGYYYDSETGFYYVSSRYYDPEIGRFLNADNNFSNYNLFMYCGNNPVNRIDPNGEHWYYLWIDDLIEAVDELMASVSNIVYGRAAYERSYYDPKGANDLWNSRPFQDTKPSQEMQIFTEFMYDHGFATDISVSVDTPKNTYVKVGASKVLSPNKNIDASYVHVGFGASTPSVLPINISYSVGIVKGVNAKENYAKHFLNIGAGAIYGFDYCWWPNGASAFSFTIGTSYGVYGGYDYYWCLD